jgi:hypothetical protein
VNRGCRESRRGRQLRAGYRFHRTNIGRVDRIIRNDVGPEIRSADRLPGLRFDLSYVGSRDGSISTDVA